MRRGLSECQTCNITLIFYCMHLKCWILHEHNYKTQTFVFDMLNINLFFFFCPLEKYCAQTFKEHPSCSYVMPLYLYPPPVRRALYRFFGDMKGRNLAYHQRGYLKLFCMSYILSIHPSIYLFVCVCVFLNNHLKNNTQVIWMEKISYTCYSVLGVSQIEKTSSRIVGETITLCPRGT